MLVTALLVAAGAHSTILWLDRVTAHPSRTVYDGPESGSLGHLSWNGSSLQLQLSPFNWSGVSHENISIWLDVISCQHLNDTGPCLVLSQSLDKIQLNKVDNWQVHHGLSTEMLESCDQFRCSVSVGNVTWPLTSHPKPNFVFGALFAIRMIGYIALDSVTPLMDATGLYMCKTHKGDFGRQKMWSMISIVCISILSGSLIDVTEKFLGIQLRL